MQRHQARGSSVRLSSLFMGVALAVSAPGVMAMVAVDEAYFDTYHWTQSALIDTSGLSYSETNFRGNMHKSAGAGDFYINSVAFVPGDDWDAGIDFDLPSDSLSYGGGTYTFGTLITGNQDWYDISFAKRFDAVSSDVTPGLYSFQIEIYGGGDASASDLIGTLDFELDVLASLDLRVSGTTVPGAITEGGKTRVDMTIENLSDVDFVLSGLFYVGGGMVQGTDALSGDFADDWYGEPVEAGTSRTIAHSEWLAEPGTPAGSYTGRLGVIGGAYDGDRHEWELTPAPMVEVAPVPLPAAGWLMLSCFATLGVLGRRRAKAS